MGNPNVSLRLGILVSLSLTTCYCYSSQRPPLTPPKATPSDLLSLLGSTSQSSKVNPLISHQLQSCFRFLVPFTPTNHFQRARRGLCVSDENELIWRPPQPVLDLARLAFDSGGDPDAIHRALDPTILPVPDAEGSKENRCQLTRTPYGRRFISQELNSYLEFLFKLIVARGPAVGLNVSLNRYDLFHGHLFIARDTARLGILFHAKEYPAYDKDVFPYNMGYCQIGSTVTYNDSMNLRNILWLAPLPNNSTNDWEAPGVLVVLDAHPEGIIYRDIIPDYVNFVRTIYEDDLGNVAVDVNYLNIGNRVPSYQIFIC
ncbi:hypothetical protein K2173_004804 [Erythroxylum novogranatense]|uniref:Uncharacterized protein n=1 Tax=Erythroxylum novogranatense TaxID=1862640 RepID=A0AAV8SJS4_9ROSI|nr:hypothetical protein K2173_004804 [Erythroxylum novogranatense]